MNKTIEKRRILTEAEQRRVIGGVRPNYWVCPLCGTENELYNFGCENCNYCRLKFDKKAERFSAAT